MNRWKIRAAGYSGVFPGHERSNDGLLFIEPSDAWGRDLLMHVIAYYYDLLRVDLSVITSRSCSKDILVYQTARRIDPVVIRGMEDPASQLAVRQCATNARIHKDSKTPSSTMTYRSEIRYGG